jgi:signal transduction histidine kinase
MVRERHWFFFMLEMLILAACLYLGFEGQSVSVLVACSLIGICLLTAKLLVELLQGPVWLVWLSALLCMVALFLYGTDLFLPLAIALLCDVLDKRLELPATLALTLVATALLTLIFPQRLVSLLGVVAAGILAFAGILLLRPLVRMQAELTEKDERLDALQARFESQREAISSIERQSRQAERNRLAARIHDKVGHGVTGSILMLEAAQLQLDTNISSARASIEKATENLRTSVDEIRLELRDERSAAKQVSLARIVAELDTFSDEHPHVRCELETAGSLDALPQAVWVCIYESLRETLVNLLRHSSADRLHVLISHRNRLVYVEFGDNGSAVQTDETELTGRGIGLTAIQERALLAGGRAFFSLTPRGFTTKLTFPLGSAG